MKRSWRDIFEKFNATSDVSKLDLKNLLLMAGHLNSKTAEFSMKTWNAEMKKIKEKIFLKNGKILEIGCGTGALLKSFENQMKIYGIDFSHNMIGIASKAIPSGQFKICEAKNLNFQINFFDSVILYSCAQYFPNKNYLKLVLNKCSKVLKKNGKLYIGELVEKDKQFKFNQFRKKQLSPSEYKKKYLGKQNIALKHFAINRDEIFNLLNKKFKNIEIFNSITRGKEDEIYRFDICCQKK